MGDDKGTGGRGVPLTYVDDGPVVVDVLPPAERERLEQVIVRIKDAMKDGAGPMMVLDSIAPRPPEVADDEPRVLDAVDIYARDVRMAALKVYRAEADMVAAGPHGEEPLVQSGTAEIYRREARMAAVRDRPGVAMPAPPAWLEPLEGQMAEERAWVKVEQATLYGRLPPRRWGTPKSGKTSYLQLARGRMGRTAEALVALEAGLRWGKTQLVDFNRTWAGLAAALYVTRRHRDRLPRGDERRQLAAGRAAYWAGAR